jgi:hypothetical protein
MGGGRRGGGGQRRVENQYSCLFLQLLHMNNFIGSKCERMEGGGN